VVDTDNSIILSALGLPIPDHLPAHPALQARANPIPRSAIHRSVILEAEVVPYNEGVREGNRGPGIEEFWWLGAAGVTAEATGPR
jgi:DNA ligase-4